jgi:isoleucyl-tRNA synthetase
VAVDTTIDDALRAEGLAREIINKVQNLRKKSGLEVSDRIALIVAGAEPAQQAGRDHAERIRQETLAVTLETDAASGELAHRDSFRIDDSEITIMLARS